MSEQELHDSAIALRVPHSVHSRPVDILTALALHFATAVHVLKDHLIWMNFLVRRSNTLINAPFFETACVEICSVQPRHTHTHTTSILWGRLISVYTYRSIETCHILYDQTNKHFVRTESTCCPLCSYEQHNISELRFNNAATMNLCLHYGGNSMLNPLIHLEEGISFSSFGLATANFTVWFPRLFEALITVSWLSLSVFSTSSWC